MKRIDEHLRPHPSPEAIRQEALQRLGGDPGARERALLELLHYQEGVQECLASTDFGGVPLFFDALRLQVRGFTFLLEKICVHDCYFVRGLPQAPVVMDVGSHIGVLPRFVLRERPGATVYALEPDRSNARTLRLNLEPFKTARAYDIGALDAPRTERLHISAKTDWRSTMMFDDDPEDRFEEGEIIESYDVRVDTVDNIAAAEGIERLDLLKITASIHGHLALTGAQRTVAALRPIVAVSAQDAHLGEVRSVLDAAGGYAEVPCPLPNPGMQRIYVPEERLEAVRG